MPQKALSPKRSRAFEPQSLDVSVQAAIQRAQNLLLTHQFPEGYWWYTLEANETIGAEYILLREFLGTSDPGLSQALCRRMLSQQREDGSWAIYFGGPGDLSTTLECYWVLKLCGYPLDHPAMATARRFILDHGGPTKSRVFTKIHLAMFGLAPWEAAPAMPYVLMMLPKWSPIHIYEFSSWARACIVPLLIVLNEKPVHLLPIDLEELYPEPPEQRNWTFSSEGGDYFSLGKIFIILDKFLKGIEKIKIAKFRRSSAIKRCVKYIREHIEKTEDIYPALAYAAIALKTLGHENTDPTISKCLTALRSFQQLGNSEPAHTNKGQGQPSVLPHIPRAWEPSDLEASRLPIHQQCCISPVWDTPWAAVSLVDSGLDPLHPAIQRAAHWLARKQILHTRGDWTIKNRKTKPGGWSFEFENEYFPDVDDTLEVLTLFYKMGLPTDELVKSFDLGLDWLLSMQSTNGGWAAFDINNTLHLVNHIPFSDHGACLDPPTPDITGRILELLALLNFERSSLVVERAIRFIEEEQKSCGAWEGRWGVNYLYGTWCVLTGLVAMGEDPKNARMQRAVEWLLSVQNEDGGWGESCAGYSSDTFTPLPHSVPSQTAWAVMGLVAAGETRTPAVARGIQFLIDRQNTHGCWDEKEYTGTGFPGHFYIRYHGYRHYFPLLALGRYRRALRSA